MAKFCGKCGKPIELCTCSDARERPMRAATPPPRKMAYSTIARVDGVVLGEGEQVVREYTLGRFPFGIGYVTLVITNKRVILKESYELLIFKSARIEELNLEAVHGVSGTIGRGINLAIFMIGLIITIYAATMASIMSRYSYYGGGGGGASIVGIIIGIVLMVVSTLFPHMTFSVIGMGSDHRSLATGINLNGKTALRSGILFQPRPVAGASDSIAEAGACIFDLRTYGDEAIAKWKHSR